MLVYIVYIALCICCLCTGLSANCTFCIALLRFMLIYCTNCVRAELRKCPATPNPPPQQLLYFHSYLLRDGAGAVVPCPWPLPCCALSNPLPPTSSPFYFILWAHAFISRHLTKAKSSHIVYLEADGHLYEINLYTHTHTQTQTHAQTCIYVCT